MSPVPRLTQKQAAHNWIQSIRAHWAEEGPWRTRAVREIPGARILALNAKWNTAVREETSALAAIFAAGNRNSWAEETVRARQREAMDLANILAQEVSRRKLL